MLIAIFCALLFAAAAYKTLTSNIKLGNELDDTRFAIETFVAILMTTIILVFGRLNPWFVTIGLTAVAIYTFISIARQK